MPKEQITKGKTEKNREEKLSKTINITLSSSEVASLVAAIRHVKETCKLSLTVEKLILIEHKLLSYYEND